MATVTLSLLAANKMNGVGETIATLNAQIQRTITKRKKLRGRKRDLKAFDLSALSESLPGLEASEQKSSAAKLLKVDCKSRLKFILQESKQIVRVLSHPKFLADPLGSIQPHLETIQPIEELKKKRNINGSKKRKEEKSKASARPSTMEM
ncbi:uncharacterized protein LOC120073082 [Benincasa hispida]|uniref:uncharacterized protein LOC120073082 n=1 Tax=Benincasa hispida TaxID=102211 RepID=UPI001900C566|nr:uncharacterized protein LOC120073082 [Benincasa hispida]